MECSAEALPPPLHTCCSLSACSAAAATCVRPSTARSIAVNPPCAQDTHGCDSGTWPLLTDCVPSSRVIRYSAAHYATGHRNWRRGTMTTFSLDCSVAFDPAGGPARSAEQRLVSKVPAKSTSKRPRKASMVRRNQEAEAGRASIPGSPPALARSGAMNDNAVLALWHELDIGERGASTADCSICALSPPRQWPLALCGPNVAIPWVASPVATPSS